MHRAETLRRKENHEFFRLRRLNPKPQFKVGRSMFTVDESVKGRIHPCSVFEFCPKT